MEEQQIYTLKDLKSAFKAGGEMVYYPAHPIEHPLRSESRPEPKYYNFDHWFEQFTKKKNNQ